MNALVLAHVIHITSVCVWIGVMFFNLIIGFPMFKARSHNTEEYCQWLSEQGTRAAPWLYLLIGLTFFSGWALYYLSPSMPEGPIKTSFKSYFLMQNAQLFAMFCCHWYATRSIWPRIFFATDSELPALILKYQASILASTAIGMTAILSASLRLAS